MLLANLVGRGRQAAPHEAHAAHEAQMKRYQVRQAEAATHTCHTHSPHTHTLDAKRAGAREARRRRGALQLKHSHYAAAGAAELPATAIKEPKIAS